MSEPDSTPAPVSPDIRQPVRWLPSLVWLIPLIAAVVGLSLLIHTLLQNGPEISVTFRTAEGLTPGKTVVRYKSVDIGRVKSVHLAQDRSHVIAVIALSNDAESFLARDTRFWVVRPRLAVSGVSGLETLLSGAYIGVDAGKSAIRVKKFNGLEVPPAITTDVSGKQFTLRAADLGSLDIGSPVYYRRMQVGQVVAYRLNPDARGISLRVFVNRPYDKLVTTDTRFWHASGVDLKLDAGGIKLNTQALATVLLGGVAFQEPDHPINAALANENAEFMLAADQAEAMKPRDELAPELAVLNFDQSVRGLSPGSPVDFRGIVIGQVRSIGIDYVREKKMFRFPVVIELYPSRIGLDVGELRNKRYARDIAETMNKRGMRAQLRTGNMLTGQLYVAFDFFPNAPAAKVNIDGPMPELATMPGGLDELQTKLGNIVARIDKIPFDDIARELRVSMASLDKTLNNADKLLVQLNGNVVPEFAAAMQDARKMLQTANSTLSSDAPLQQDTRRTLQELTRAAASLRTLTDYLERHPEALIRGKVREEAP
ncbi:qaraquat-inducible protein B [Herbaspirillum sp. CF444]|uniref:PqiB family protein n=1 Tax=Herbaspirillum sp. CF444 TaxID=1144319 RepID=UPI000272736D|nr:MlaD family protein [Herbaspirillum sp. CF444]EJL92402.1 qaraquat-inducible protein B [Herbaspirillum sp. CF444]